MVIKNLPMEIRKQREKLIRWKGKGWIIDRKYDEINIENVEFDREREREFSRKKKKKEKTRKE